MNTPKVVITDKPVQKTINVTMKVSAKRGLSIYGLQRMPITLYADQWLALLGMKPDIVKFIEKNRDHLSFKSEEVA